MVQVIAGILAQHQPRAIFYPHEADWNSTHIGTHHLVADASRRCRATFSCAAVETEFWGQMPLPNVLIESPPAEVGALITALTWHVGEVQRNPYHLTLPAWMMDNVRRGGEWIGGQGKAAPEFLFGTLYRLRRWNEGRIFEVRRGFRQGLSTRVRIHPALRQGDLARRASGCTSVRISDSHEKPFCCSCLAAAAPTSWRSEAPLNKPPSGFTALFNGKDLTGWRGRQPNYNAVERRS